MNTRFPLKEGGLKLRPSGNEKVTASSRIFTLPDSKAPASHRQIVWMGGGGEGEWGRGYKAQEPIGDDPEVTVQSSPPILRACP